MASVEVTVEQFEAASAYVRAAGGKLKQDQQLQIYGWFKQASIGDCNVKKPGMLDFAGKAKWESWSALKGMSAEDARKIYVTFVNDTFPGWSDGTAPPPSAADGGADGGGGGGGGGGMMGPVFSQLGVLGDDGGSEKRDLCYFSSTNDIPAMEALVASGATADLCDDAGQTPLHHAADRGHMDAVMFLLKTRGCNINAKADDGGTALHYAALCGHPNVVSALLAAGADASIKDDDGCTARDNADDAGTKAAFDANASSIVAGAGGT